MQYVIPMNKRFLSNRVNKGIKIWSRNFDHNIFDIRTWFMNTYCPWTSQNFASGPLNVSTFLYKNLHTWFNAQKIM